MNATRRSNDVNFGDRERVRGREQRTLAWISVEQSQPLTVYVAAEVDAPPALISRIRPIASIAWGHGGASLAEEYAVARRLRVPLVGSMVSVAVRLVDVVGVPVPDDVSADCAAVIAPGLDSDATRNTRWVATHGSGGILSPRPERVVGLHGYSTAAGARWLLLFDKRVAAAAGDTPVLATPVSPTPFAVADEDGRPFYAGVVWGVSQDPLAFQPDAAADVRLEVGFLL